MQEESVRLQTNSGFGFSMVKAQNLTETSYTLALIMLDVTGSVTGEEAEIKRMLDQLIADGKRSGWGKRVLISAMTFNSSIGVRELFGFDVAAAIDTSGIQIVTAGATNLIDALITGTDAIEKAASELKNIDFMNLLLIGVTDGEDNVSNSSVNDLENSLERARKSESYDSFKSILVGLRTGQQTQDPRYSGKTVDVVLSELANDAKFDQYVSAKEVKDGTYGQLGEFITESISSASMALGSGTPSANIDFNV